MQPPEIIKIAKHGLGDHIHHFIRNIGGGHEGRADAKGRNVVRVCRDTCRRE